MHIDLTAQPRPRDVPYIPSCLIAGLREEITEHAIAEIAGPNGCVIIYGPEGNGEDDVEWAIGSFKLDGKTLVHTIKDADVLVDLGKTHWTSLKAMKTDIIKSLGVTPC